MFDALQSTMGVLYVNDFNKFGHTYRVQLQAEGAYRAKPEDLGNVYVRSSGGDMIPVKALINVRSTTGPDQLDRFNGFLAAKVIGNGAPGISSGQAIANVEEVARVDFLPATPSRGPGRRSRRSASARRRSSPSSSRWSWCS